MFKKIFTGLIVLTCSFPVMGAELPAKTFNYYYALMEYYALYCDRIGAKELDEASILMYPEKYTLHEKDSLNRLEDLKEVNEELKKIIPVIQKGAHEYRILLKGTFGPYDSDKGGFRCDIVNDRSCLDLTPLENDENNAGTQEKEKSIISRGLMFGKINRIKVFFINAEDYMILQYPADKVEAFQKGRTDSLGTVDKEIYAVLTLEILPKYKNKSEWNDVRRKIYEKGMESNYLLLARIKSIEAYDDTGLSDKLGDFGSGEKYQPFQTIKIQ